MNLQVISPLTTQIKADVDVDMPILCADLHDKLESLLPRLRVEKNMFTLIFYLLLLNILFRSASFFYPRCFWRMKQNESKNEDERTGCFFYISVAHPRCDTESFRKYLKTLYTIGNDRVSMALAFAAYELYRNPDLLPNTSFIYYTDSKGCRTHSNFYNKAPSASAYYKAHYHYCTETITCLWVLTGPNWAMSVKYGKLFYLILPRKFLQLTFGPFHPILSDQEQFPYVYQMAPRDISLALAMVSLMLHFNWNWVGLVISDVDQGIQFLSDLREETKVKRVCLAFVIIIPDNKELYMSRVEVYTNQIMTSSTKVVIIYGETNSNLAMSFRTWECLGIQRIWVTTSQWDVTACKRDFTLDSSYGTLAFSHHHREMSGFKDFLQTFISHRYSDEYLARVEWMNFNCEISASKCKTLKTCLSNTSLEWLIAQTFDMAFSDGSYILYNALYTTAHMFHKLVDLELNEHMSLGNNCLKTYSLLKKINFTNPVGDTVDMDQNKNLQVEYDIFQIWNYPNGLELKVKIGEFSPYFLHGQQLHLYEDVIEWATGSRQMPPSVCSADCDPGFRKFRQEGHVSCCFTCRPCPENEVSNETNVDNCVKCPEDNYANAEQNKCIPKAVTFLTYEEPLGMALFIMVLCFTAFTLMVLGVFVKHHETPIVKANNRNLSYILLISLIFCFLCSLLFIGYPNTTTCILQQITFGVVFTVAVSTVLAKTVTVLLAFKVTAPGRRTRYLISRAPNYIIAICSLIQIVLCTIWLAVSSPFIDTDPYSEHGHIIIVCDKGSLTAFYCVLGYHGLLAFGSFSVAFLARNLPDTFNEAKFLTFSMLLFCTVWVIFLPVYHSTKGKIMVSVEVFSIMASSAGLLGCIFFPKCYIILLRPEKNSLQNLKKKTSYCTNLS